MSLEWNWNSERWAHEEAEYFIISNKYCELRGESQCFIVALWNVIVLSHCRTAFIINNVLEPNVASVEIINIALIFGTSPGEKNMEMDGRRQVYWHQKLTWARVGCRQLFHWEASQLRVCHFILCMEGFRSKKFLFLCQSRGTSMGKGVKSHLLHQTLDVASVFSTIYLCENSATTSQKPTPCSASIKAASYNLHNFYVVAHSLLFY